MPCIMAWSFSLREVADKASDLFLVAIMFGLQAAIATGEAATWL